MRELSRGAVGRVGRAAVAAAVHERDPVRHAAGAEQRAEARHPEEVDPEVQRLEHTHKRVRDQCGRNVALGRPGSRGSWPGRVVVEARRGEARREERAHVVEDEPRQRRQVQVAHQRAQLGGRGACGRARLEHVLQLREHRVRRPRGHCAHARDQNRDGRRDLLQTVVDCFFCSSWSVLCTRTSKPNKALPSFYCTFYKSFDEILEELNGASRILLECPQENFK